MILTIHLRRLGRALNCRDGGERISAGNGRLTFGGIGVLLAASALAVISSILACAIGSRPFQAVFAAPQMQIPVFSGIMTMKWWSSEIR